MGRKSGAKSLIGKSVWTWYEAAHLYDHQLDDVAAELVCEDVTYVAGKAFCHVRPSDCENAPTIPILRSHICVASHVDQRREDEAARQGGSR